MKMNKKSKRLFTTAAGAAMLLSGCAQNVVQDEAVADTNYGAAAEAASDVVLSKVANVQGDFSFDQETITPNDQMFNIFGTALTGICAKPAYALGQGSANYYINVGGQISEGYSVDLTAMSEEKSTTRTMLCACATGSATAMGNVTGIKVADVIQMADIDEGVNTIKVIGADGYGQEMPLSYVLEKEAMIVYRINGEDVPSGTQFWCPATVAKYFTRDVVEIQLLANAEEPVIEQRDDSLRAEICILNSTDAVFEVGQQIVFEGYADDFGDAIAAVEFSLDGGETWTAYETENAYAERWVYWKFGYAPEAAGAYQLTVRAVTASGKVSPLAAAVDFTVAETDGTLGA